MSSSDITKKLEDLSLSDVSSFWEQSTHEEALAALRTNPQRFHVLHDFNKKKNFWNEPPELVFQDLKAEGLDRINLIHIEQLDKLDLQWYKDTFQRCYNYVVLDQPGIYVDYVDEKMLISDFLRVAAITNTKTYVKSQMAPFGSSIEFHQLKECKNLTLDAGITRLTIINKKSEDPETECYIDKLSGSSITSLEIKCTEPFPKMTNIDLPRLDKAKFAQLLSSAEQMESIGKPDWVDESLKMDFSFLERVIELETFLLAGPLVNCPSFKYLKDLTMYLAHPMESIEIPTLQELRLLILLPSIKQLPVITAPDLRLFDLKLDNDFCAPACAIQGTAFMDNIGEAMDSYSNLKELDIQVLVKFNTKGLDEWLIKRGARSLIVLDAELVSQPESLGDPSLFMEKLQRLCIQIKSDELFLRFKGPEVVVITVLASPIMKKLVIENFPALKAIASMSKVTQELVLSKVPEVREIRHTGVLRSLKADSLTKLELLQYGLTGSDTKRTVEHVKKMPGMFSKFKRVNKKLS